MSVFGNEATDPTGCELFDVFEQTPDIQAQKAKCISEWTASQEIQHRAALEMQGQETFDAIVWIGASFAVAVLVFFFWRFWVRAAEAAVVKGAATAIRTKRSAANYGASLKRKIDDDLKS